MATALVFVNNGSVQVVENAEKASKTAIYDAEDNVLVPFLPGEVIKIELV